MTGDFLKGYYFITDASLSRAGNIPDIRSALISGVRLIQYRNKNSGGNARPIYEEAMCIKELCRGHGALLIINDRADIALATDADGIHIGQDDLPLDVVRDILGPGKIIGVTVHNAEEAVLAAKGGAAYLAVSPIFSTATKPDAGPPSGIALINEIKKISTLPVAAIGGIDHSNARDVISAGADMICAISAVVTSHNPAEEIKKFHEMFHR